jgi:hypothetical protein
MYCLQQSNPQSGSIKDLNALEREKIQQIDIKKSDNSTL